MFKYSIYRHYYICDVQVVKRGRQRSFERLTPLKNLITLNSSEDLENLNLRMNLITLNSSEDLDFLSQMFLK